MLSLVSRSCLLSLLRLRYFWEAACQGLPGVGAWHCQWFRDSTFASGLLLHVGVCAYHLCPSPAGRLVPLHASQSQAAGDQNPEAGFPAGPSYWCQGHMNWKEMVWSCTQTLFIVLFTISELDTYCLVTTSHYWDISLYYEMLSQNAEIQV